MFKNLMPGAIGIDRPLLETLELARATGYQGLELDLPRTRELAKERSVAYVRGLFDDAGLRIGGWDLPVNVMATDTVYYEHLAALSAAARFAADLGCFRCLGGLEGGHDSRPFKDNWDFLLKRLRPAAEILKDYGHALALEFIGPVKCRAAFKYNFIYSLDGMLAFCAAIGTGNVGLLFDTWHCYTSHATLEDIGKLAKDDVVYVHINDAPEGIAVNEHEDLVRALPGETGIIPLVEILGILKDIGYDGPVTPEPFSEKLAGMAPAEAARTVMTALDKVWQEAGLS